MILEASDIVSGYGKLEILHGINISVEEGKITALIGPNGAGKSTFLKTVFGYLKPTRGNVAFEGKDITGLRPDKVLKSGISYVPQGRSTFPYMTVYENIKMGAFILTDRKETEKAITDVLERFPVLEKRKDQMAGSLSGGEQRMLELGRAYILKPKLMMLDEPSLGLAPKLIEETYEEIIKFKESGISLLIVEQNVRRVLSVADYTYVLDLGTNAFEGSSKDLLGDRKLIDLYLGT